MAADAFVSKSDLQSSPLIISIYVISSYGKQCYIEIPLY